VNVSSIKKVNIGSKLKWYSFLFVGLIFLLLNSITGCGQPRWCAEKLTSYTNYEYGYKLYFPPDASLVTYWEGSSTVLINDDVSIISVAIHQNSFNPSKFADDFIENIETRNEIGEGENSESFHDYPQRWNYVVEMNHRGKDDNFAEIRYTYLKKDVIDIDPVKIKTIPVKGEIYWQKSRWNQK
jgi:hypothetical protein